MRLAGLLSSSVLRSRKVLLGLSVLMMSSATALAVRAFAVSESGQSTSSSEKSQSVQNAPDSTSCISDESVIEDIRNKRAELESKEKTLAERELELSAKEKALDERIQKLERIKSEIAQDTTGRRKEQDQQVEKLVATFETMSPKAVSQVIASLDEGLAVRTMSRIQTPKLAKILNLMDPAKSARLTELLVGVDRNRSQSNQSVKGGEGKNGQINNDDSNATDERGSESGQGPVNTSDTQNDGVQTVARRI